MKPATRHRGPRDQHESAYRTHFIRYALRYSRSKEHSTGDLLKVLHYASLLMQLKYAESPE